MPAAGQAAELNLDQALRPWVRRLVVEALGHWLLRGVVAGLLLASLVMAVGWVIPWPESELQPLALQLAAPVVLALALLAFWPVSTARRTAQLDERLGFADRLATAWLHRQQTSPMLALQRSDALRRLAERSPRHDLPLRVAPTELGALVLALVLAGLFALAPSPQQRTLQAQAQDQAAVQQATQQLDALRADLADTDTSSLSPDQARRLDELLRQARDQLNTAQNRDQASAVLTNVAQQTRQLADPNADAIDAAIAAMSETLTQEPLTRPLANALAHNDAAGADQAVQQLEAQADQLSDVQRQALARALQRAANVNANAGGDPTASSALRQTASALSSGDTAQAQQQLGAAGSSLQSALQTSAADAQLQSAVQRLQDVRNGLAAGTPQQADALADLPPGGGLPSSGTDASGTPVPLDASGAGQLRPEPSTQQGAGVGAGAAPGEGTPTSSVEPSEDIFVPGEPSNGASASAEAQAPFTVRGGPRPYREVLAQYAQSSRDAIDHSSVPPNVRSLVEQYLNSLEQDQ